MRRAIVWAAVIGAPVAVAAAVAFSPAPAPTVTMAPAANVVQPVPPVKACHTAYIVEAHHVPAHTVKATAGHSAYVVYAHNVPAHVVKANC